MIDTRPRLTTRSIKTAEHIRDMKGFTTSGALSAREVDGLGNWDSGKLGGSDLDQFRLDCYYIDYVVYSYSTPIAWHWTSEDGKAEGWHIVSQKFSSTTSKHQGNLYLIPRDVALPGQGGVASDFKCDRCGAVGKHWMEDCPKDDDWG